MQNRLSDTLKAALLMLLIASSAMAAEKNAIQVDVLVFAQPGIDGTNYWQDTRPLPVCHAVALREGSGAEAAFSNNNDCYRQPGFEAAYSGFAATSSNALPTQAATLKTASYSLLLNRQWQQANGNLSPVFLRGGKTIGARQELQGTLSLKTDSNGKEATLALVLTRMEGDKPRYVTLQESRIIEPGKVNYFDHPLFGVLLKISPAP